MDVCFVHFLFGCVFACVLLFSYRFFDVKRLPRLEKPRLGRCLLLFYDTGGPGAGEVRRPERWGEPNRNVLGLALLGCFLVFFFFHFFFLGGFLEFFFFFFF